MRAKEMMPDDVNQAVINGVNVRKGSVGAFLANARMLAAPETSVEDRQTAERDVIEALPALQALGLFDVLDIRDAHLRAFVETHSGPR
ncbi:hypothetical protein [Bradyrhizobium australafricanum]|uniref:hypothetical protein n=1 Tax=Bradyrhizobium australafricanum TaxID=2821406 RepID=UPI001CE3869D|nr:hypothetical protein [Bradyrhizobium australafricanum]MCA6100082.1 hypothetical protein [Bradyrhizobium australafricanum]